ncbi:hypothetical protein D9615_010494 [Tricholomella constricta]|uniref:FIST domain-containing protein n=1 Tax=Tricholomella constricta TaxID=117010 RepID=A0A8H5GMM5_9AGAR|nr:hypothetical protein D9615_010494 [Tricholomella constricta]
MQTFTLLTRSPSALVAHLTRLQQSYAEHTLLFTLSPNAPPSVLSQLVQRLTSFSHTSLGCLSTPLPLADHLACSLLLFPPGTATPFRSSLPGRSTPQVGRWHAFRTKDDAPAAPTEPPAPDAQYTWAEIWARNTQDTALPESLHDLNPADVSEVLYLTDRAPEGLLNSLGAFPGATRLGLVAASTPFITGRPVTLFHNDKIHESGAVGLALRRIPRGRASTDFPGVVPISAPTTVTRCEGNMVNELNDTNPTQLLLRAIRERKLDTDTSGSFKDNESFLLGTLHKGTVQQMYSITAGDPSRGSISLASQTAPVVGTQVQFFHRPKSLKLDVPAAASVPTIKFLSCAEVSSDAADAAVGDVVTVPNTFIGASENGFVLSRPGEAAWTCTVAGGVASIEWA